MYGLDSSDSEGGLEVDSSEHEGNGVQGCELDLSDLEGGLVVGSSEHGNPLIPQILEAFKMRTLNVWI
jgi:hypothetical protein